jgi:hypothetical protein
MAEKAVGQINQAVETMSDGGNTRRAAYYEEQLSRARTILARAGGR